MQRVFRLALAADGLALLTLVLGSWTRINGAGLTCPDWPLCHGHLIPSMGDGTQWEWTHRLLASALSLAIVALIAIASKHRKRSPFIAPTIWAIATLFVAQVVLGAETVRLGNTPISVVLHWGTAMALIATLSAMAVFARATESASPLRTGTGAATVVALGVTTVAAFLTMCVGAYVSSSGAGLACLSIPGCAGTVVVYTAGQSVQMLHRIDAALTLLCAVTAFALAWARPASAKTRAAASIGMALICVQIVLGLLNVALRLPVDLREAHAINASLAFIAFFVATVFAMLDGVSRVAPQMTTNGASFDKLRMTSSG
jgi:heme A synthase